MLIKILNVINCHSRAKFQKPTETLSSKQKVFKITMYKDL